MFQLLLLEDGAGYRDGVGEFRELGHGEIILNSNSKQ